MTNNWRKVEREADALLQAAGLAPLDHEGAEFGRLCRRLLVAKQEYLQIENDRWKGVYKTRSAIAGEGSVPPSAKTVTQSKPFTEVVKLYFQENTRAKRTDSQVKAELERFVEKEHMLQVRKLTLATVIKHLSSLRDVQVERGARLYP